MSTILIRLLPKNIFKPEKLTAVYEILSKGEIGIGHQQIKTSNSYIV